MSQAWELPHGMQDAVCDAMAQHTRGMIASLAHILSHEYGEPCGTGTYLALRDKIYVLTNEHVAKYMGQGGLSHLPREGDYAHRLIHPFLAMEPPVDAAISRVDDVSWDGATKQAIPADRIARVHQTATHELLFLQGFPGERSRWSALAQGLMAKSVPYLTQEVPLPPGLDPRFYFALAYNPAGARSIDGKSVYLPLPPGFSGSLVWNTRFVETLGNGWKPESAMATGLICMWGQGEDANIILGVRIEIVRQMILRALREEAAYFHWLGRGAPTDGDPLDDWVPVERSITDLA